MAGMNETPSGERIHIGIFGRRNAGKSSLINALTGQNIAIVSDVAGTTTDPVSKAMELLPLGPVVIIDTPGLDDVGELGALRVEKARQALAKCDIAIVVIDSTRGISEFEDNIISDVKARNIPYILVYSKSDMAAVEAKEGIAVSAATGEGIEALKSGLAKFAKKEPEARLIGDLVSSGDVVLLVTPIDASAPKGRLILPQQQVIRDLLESGAMPLICRETELEAALASVNANKLRMVITDSQVFGLVSKIVPENIPLTSFSMLMARYKGNFKQAVEGAQSLDTIKTGDKVLISEGCTHHRQCEDIGTVKLPNWIRKHTGAEPEFVFTSGGEFPSDVSGYKMVIHCGGCTLNPSELKHRFGIAAEAGVPMTNYGVAIAHMHGILDRAAKPLM